MGMQRDLARSCRLFGLNDVETGGGMAGDGAEGAIGNRVRQPAVVCTAMLVLDVEMSAE